MIQPEPDLTIQEAITELFPDPINLPQDVSAKDIVFIMSSDLGDGNKEVRAAKAKCDGNYACALALLQRGVLKSETRRMLDLYAVTLSVEDPKNNLRNGVSGRE